METETQNNNPDLSQDQLDKIMEDIQKTFADINVNNSEEVLKYLQSNYLTDVPDIERPKKLIDCAHEIVFNIKASVFEENAKGEIEGCKEICQKNYHIPVPPKKDYNTYMECFFKYLEDCITSSARRSNQDVKDKND